MFSPVAYLTDVEVVAELQAVTANITTEREFLRTFGRERILTLSFTMLVAAVVSLKHVGFAEEQEWRVIYSPKRTPSALIKSTTEIISGVPQTVYKLPLDRDIAEVGELDIARVLDRVIIGPSQFSLAIHESFVNALAKAGVENPAARVVMSGIPIRT
jgi:hypothetical protein